MRSSASASTAGSADRRACCAPSGAATSPYCNGSWSARDAAGLDVSWLDAGPLRDRWGLVACGAIESAWGAGVDPFALAYAALAALVADGQGVHDRTAVTAFDFTTRRARLRTDRGATVTARWCVVATGYEAVGLVPDLPISLVTTFAFVSEPVPDLRRRFPDGLLFWDLADPYLYGRTTDDDRLLVGGRDEAHRDPTRRRRSLPVKSRALVRDAARRLPGLDLEIGYAWAGTFAETPDGLPYIGAHPRFPRCRFALGFGGNGITYSALAADYLAAELTGHPDDRAGIYRLDRS